MFTKLKNDVILEIYFNLFYLISTVKLSRHQPSLPATSEVRQQITPQEGMLSVIDTCKPFPVQTIASLFRIFVSIVDFCNSCF